MRCELFFPPASWSHRYGEEYFTLNISEFRVSPDGKHAEYKIEGNCGETEWAAWRRYTEFVHMKGRCKTILGSVVPKLPPKGLRRSLKQKHLEKRRTELCRFLHVVLGQKESKVCKDMNIRGFLGIEVPDEGIRNMLPDSEGNKFITEQDL
jgi:hypothetical protein